MAKKSRKARQKKANSKHSSRLNHTKTILVEKKEEKNISSLIVEKQQTSVEQEAGSILGYPVKLIYADILKTVLISILFIGILIGVTFFEVLKV